MDKQMDFTRQEQLALAEALPKVTNDIIQVRKILTNIGERLDAEFLESNHYIGDMAVFYADHHPVPIDFVGKNLCADRLWKRKHEEK